MSQQHRQQLRRVEPVGLAPARPSLNLDARRIDDDILDSDAEQMPMQPESIAASFEAASHRRIVVETKLGLAACDAVGERVGVAGSAGHDSNAAFACAHRQLPRACAPLERHEQGATLLLRDRLGHVCLLSADFEATNWSRIASRHRRAVLDSGPCLCGGTRPPGQIARGLCARAVGPGGRAGTRAGVLDRRDETTRRGA